MPHNFSTFSAPCQKPCVCWAICFVLDTCRSRGLISVNHMNSTKNHVKLHVDIIHGQQTREVMVVMFPQGHE